MSRWDRVQGDVGDTVTVGLLNIDDLSGVTAVEAHVWWENDRGEMFEKTTLSAAVVNGNVVVSLGAWLASVTHLGEWQLETEVTFAGGRVLTWPSGQPKDVIRVTYQGD